MQASAAGDCGGIRRAPRTPWPCDRGQKAPLDGTCAARHPALRARVLKGSQAVENVLIWASCAHVMHGVCRAAAGCSLAATLLVATQDQVPGGGPGDKPKFSLHVISACGTVPLTSKGVLRERWVPVIPMPRVQDVTAHSVYVPHLSSAPTTFLRTMRQAEAPLRRCTAALARTALLLLIALGETAWAATAQPYLCAERGWKSPSEGFSRFAATCGPGVSGPLPAPPFHCLLVCSAYQSCRHRCCSSRRYPAADNGGRQPGR